MWAQGLGFHFFGVDLMVFGSGLDGCFGKDSTTIFLPENLVEAVHQKPSCGPDASLHPSTSPRKPGAFSKRLVRTTDVHEDEACRHIGPTLYVISAMGCGV